MDNSTLILSLLSAASATCSYYLWKKLQLQNTQIADEDKNNDQRLEALKKTKAERHELRLLLNASEESLIITDPDGVIQVANESMRRITCVDHLRGRKICTVIRNKEISRTIDHLITRSQPQKKIITLANSNFGTHQAVDKAAWLIDYAPISAIESDPSSSKTLHHRITLRDITKEHRTEQIKREFVANASHELRTPLAIISGYLENLLDDDLLSDPATSRKMLTTMRKHSDRLERLIDEMLVISKLESGGSALLNLKPFNFNTIVDTVIDRLNPLIQKQASEIITKYSHDDIMLVGDTFYWEQALFNIIENALKQNAESPIKIKIHANADKESQELTIKIKDNGKGIPLADLPYIFNRFYRVQKHHSQNQVKGTGLGLSIVKHAIESHGGNISATSTPGIETTFTITCPLKKEG